MCQNRVVLDVFNFCFFREHCNAMGRLKISMDSDLIGNVTDDACVRIRSEDLEDVNCTCCGLT